MLEHGDAERVAQNGQKYLSVQPLQVLLEEGKTVRKKEHEKERKEGKSMRGEEERMRKKEQKNVTEREGVKDE